MESRSSANKIIVFDFILKFYSLLFVVFIIFVTWFCIMVIFAVVSFLLEENYSYLLGGTLIFFHFIGTV